MRHPTSVKDCAFHPKEALLLYCNVCTTPTRTKSAHNESVNVDLMMLMIVRSEVSLCVVDRVITAMSWEI